MEALKKTIEAAWEDRSLLAQKDTRIAIEEVIDLLDKGQVRVAEPTPQGWRLQEWVKKAVVLYFPIRQMETLEVGDRKSVV